MPEVKSYGRLIHIADSPDRFIKAVARALDRPDRARRERVEAMAGETWPKKVATICRRLQDSGRRRAIPTEP